ncbi:subtilisin-like protein [Zopfia rhizophila CBS 207.26]|uniref:Subtilisin-like protein n=1 Tax=Zopfia rhizophila CBS 207.26 TaxID=1314779 RepID=A0A6A6E602_9PEZI|nr:subtilisin-like protein [Zopfia rhizophila CBS 207.26]
MVAEEVAIDQRQRAAEQWFHCLHRTFDLLWPGEVGNQPNQPNPVKIAILNSGVDMSAFAYATEQIKDCKSFLKSITKFGDYVGSGTHETDLILSVAPEAEVFVARISESMKLKRETENNVKNALDHAIDEWKVDIIVLPFGFSTFSPIIEESLLRADERRILLFAAVGNHGAMEQYPYPAKSPLTIPIHSADAYGKPSVFDPPARNVNDPSFSTLGEGVKAAWPPALCGHDEQINFRVRSGSDVATVIAAATAGLVLEFARQPPLSNKPQVEAWLKSKKGMLRIFKLMSKPVNGMNFVVPWLLLDAAATPPYSDDFNSAEGGFSSQSLARWAAEFAILREVPMDLYVAT